MGIKKDIRSVYRTLNDPFYQVNWIYNHFNQNVPYINSPPSLKEYDLPENVDKLIEELLHSFLFLLFNHDIVIFNIYYELS